MTMCNCTGKFFKYSFMLDQLSYTFQFFSVKRQVTVDCHNLHVYLEFSLSRSFFIRVLSISTVLSNQVQICSILFSVILDFDLL